MRLSNIKLEAQAISTNGNKLDIGENVTCDNINIQTGVIDGSYEKIVVSGASSSIKVGADGITDSTTGENMATKNKKIGIIR